MLKMSIDSSKKKGTINKNIYGHFSEHLGRCIYEGYWVGEDSSIPNVHGIRTDVVEALKEISVPVLRWPGGCFADEYHWKDGIGPKEKRPKLVNVHWGGVTENNHFGTHEFMELCEMLGADPYICGNVGSGTVQEMREWVEYLTFDGESPMADPRVKNGRKEPWKLPFFGVGNENWGCGGNMRPEYYADLYRRYACYVRNFGENKVYKIACGPNSDDYHWTEVLMREAGRYMDGLSLHYYTVTGPSWQEKGSATEFSEEEWYITMKKTWYMEELITKHSAIMDRYDPEKRVGLIVDEWGTWHDVEWGTNPGFLYQQNTLRDALVAGINLNIFNNHCDRVHMANIAQTVNVLQAMILTQGEKMIKTPTYYVFLMYKIHQNGELLHIDMPGSVYDRTGGRIPEISSSASMDSQGRIHITLCNIDLHQEKTLECTLKDMKKSKVTGMILTHEKMNAHNTFENPDEIHPVPFNGARLTGDTLTATLPPKSVVLLTIE